MGVVKFCIVFNQPDKVYYPGQMVTGQVELVTNSVMKIRGVELKIKGRAKCKWTEEESYTDHEGKSCTRTVTKKDSEVYLKNEIILFGGREKLDLPMGDHIYPFAVMLPHKAPSSFNGSYGGVAYYAKAKIDIPMAVDKTEKQGFTVLNQMNLNYFPNLRAPYKNEKHKTFCCLCCASGPLTIIVMLPKTGFAISESIPITLEIDNASNVAVNAVYVYLKRDIHWKADGSHKDESIKLQKLRFGGVAEGQSHTWSEVLTIPPTQFPHLENCAIIKIQHELHIEADASGMHSDLDMHVPLTIGDIPLNEDPNAPIIDPNAQAFPNNASFNPGITQPGMVPPNPNVGPYMVPGMNPQISGYPNGIPAPGIPQQVLPPGAPLPQVPPSAGFHPPNLYPNAGAMPQYPVPGYPQQNAPGYPQQNTPGYPQQNAPGYPQQNAPGYPQQNTNSGGPYPPTSQPPGFPQQYPPQNTPGNPAQFSYATQNGPGNVAPYSSYPPQPAVNPECAQNLQNPDPGLLKSNFTANDGDLSLPAFNTSDITIEKSSFLSDVPKHDNENNATPSTPLLPSSPSAPPHN